jgi:hypothetical protein
MHTRKQRLQLMVILLGFVLAPNPAPARAEDEAAPGLHKNVMAYLQQNVAPYVQRGDSFAIVTQLAPLVARLTPSEFKEVDEQFREWNLPSADAVLLDARLDLLQQGFGDQLPKVGKREAALTAAEITRRIQEVLDTIQKHTLFQEKTTQFYSFAAYERGFWDLHVFDNQLQGVAMLAKYGEQISKRLPRPKSDAAQPAGSRNRTDAASKPPLEEFPEFGRRINVLYEDLQERKIELRIQRCDFAYQLLTSGGSFIDRLQAAFFMDLDGELIATFFAKHPQPVTFRRAKLRDPELAANYRNKVEHIRRDYADTITRGQLLFEGLHFWMRGRYGTGTDGYGLLKPVLATVSDEAAFGLYMPVEPPLPTDPMVAQPTGTNSYIPQVDRRHHYIWMYEYRQFRDLTAIQNTTQTDRDDRVTSKTKFRQFY